MEALEDTLQELYIEGGVTGRVARRLLGQVRLSQDAYAAGDPGLAFAHLSGAHGLIDTAKARGQISTEDAAFRLHRAVDLVGATVAANPP